MSSRGEAFFRTAMQVLAILGLLLIAAVILHKGHADMALLAREHQGGDFWQALARHVLRHMGA